MNINPEHKAKMWSAATSCKASDNIVSSRFALQKVFVPSYEREKRPCMEQLLTNEYQRIWWQEKESWDKIHSKKVATKDLLQRMIIRKKPPAVPVIGKTQQGRKLRNKKKTKISEVAEERTEENA